MDEMMILTDTVGTASSQFGPSTAIHSPFRYVGGKFWMRNSILPLIPPHQHYVEPFAGGASIFFLQSGVSFGHLNDLDAELMNCYVHIRDHPEMLIKRLMPLTIHPDTHRYIKNEFEPANDLDRAMRYYYLNHTSYAGITNLKTCYWGARSPVTVTQKGWIKRIRRASKRLQGVHLTNQDFEAVIEAVPDGSFLFVDPPYRSTRHYKYYAHVFCWEDHQRLAACLQRHNHRIRFLVTYDDCTQVQNLYNWAPRLEAIDRPNRIDRLDNKFVSGLLPAQHSVSRELLIRNYAGPSRKWSILQSRGGVSVSDFIVLTDDQWAAVESVLSPLPRRSDDRGRPWRDSREALDGILWKLCWGLPWNRIPGNYPPYQTCHRRYLRWLADGTLAAVVNALWDSGGSDLYRLPELSVELPSHQPPDTSVCPPDRDVHPEIVGAFL